MLYDSGNPSCSAAIIVNILNDDPNWYPSIDGSPLISGNVVFG